MMKCEILRNSVNFQFFIDSTSPFLASLVQSVEVIQNFKTYIVTSQFLQNDSQKRNRTSNNNTLAQSLDRARRGGPFFRVQFRIKVRNSQRIFSPTEHAT
jgi:hypothetical protein